MYKASYDGSIYNQMKVHFKNTGQLLEEPTPAMREIAHHDGLFRTFQDDNVTAAAFVGIKKTLNLQKDFGIGDVTIKYPKTPANLLNRGLVYSPGGFVKLLFDATRPLRGKQQIDQKEFVETFTRALVGTSAFGTGAGALLHRIGIVTGKREQDPDIRQLQRENGLGDYRINASALKRFVMSGFDTETAKLQKGDTLINYDWFQPLAIAISIGANIDDSFQRSVGLEKGTIGVGGTLLEGFASGIDTIGEQPLLQNLTRALKFGDASDVILELAQQVPASFIPTLLKQVNELVDNTQRNVYENNIILEAFNLAKKKVPGLAQTLQPRVTTFGEPATIYQKQFNDDGTPKQVNNMFNVFFNPAFRSVYNPTPESELVLDLFSETGETKQAPRIVQKTITVNGEKVELNARQKTAMQQFVGTQARWYFHQLAQDAQFNSLTAEEKVNHMSTVLTDIGKAAKIIVLGDQPRKNPGFRTSQIYSNYLNNPFLENDPLFR